MTAGNLVVLKDLVGIHALSGIGREITENSQRVVMRLDGVLYLVTGSGDDYRDSVDTVERILDPPMPVSLIQPPLIVEVHHRAAWDWAWVHGNYNVPIVAESDVIFMVDQRTGLVVLEIGTHDIVDYYPSFVFAWNPEGWSPAYLQPQLD